MQRQLDINEVPKYLISQLPFFALVVDEHLAAYGDEPMLYELLHKLFCVAKQSAARLDKEGLKKAKRIYEIVEHALEFGTPDVILCFSITMVEPFSFTKRMGVLKAVVGP